MLCALYSMIVFSGKDITRVIVSLGGGGGGGLLNCNLESNCLSVEVNMKISISMV